jgi:hypothetical protein
MAMRAPVPDIRVAHAEEVESDLREDIDHSTGMSHVVFRYLCQTVLRVAEYRVRTLYPYDGHRVLRTYVRRRFGLRLVTYSFCSVR